MTSATLTRRRLGWPQLLGLGLLALLALAALVFLTAPPARRLLANPAGQAAVVGDTSIDVLGDSFQNHIYAPPVVRVPVGAIVTWTFNDRGASGPGQLIRWRFALKKAAGETIWLDDLTFGKKNTPAHRPRPSRWRTCRPTPPSQRG